MHTIKMQLIFLLLRKGNGITGEYAPPAGYLVNEKEAEAFDREFPYMEKEKLPGQIFE